MIYPLQKDVATIFKQEKVSIFLKQRAGNRTAIYVKETQAGAKAREQECH
jgi:hypothetical protein